ncbi:MAG: hypothetical protein AB1921_20570 [Thermodesulfobacteriota bacterium]
MTEENVPASRPFPKDMADAAEFGMLMLGMYGVMRFSTYWSPDFRARIAERDAYFAMTAGDSVQKRYFRFKNGKVSSSLRPRHEVDFTLIWRTAAEGNRVMRDMVAGKPKALFFAVVEKKLGLSGDAGHIQHFLETINRMAKLYRKKKPKKEGEKKQAA